MWRIEYDPTAQLLGVRLRGNVSAAELGELGSAHADALSATAGKPFKVFLDARGLFPLETDGIATLETIKRVATELPGCRGIVVLTDSPTVAMQQQRSKGSGSNTDTTDVVTLDPNEARELLLA